MSRYVCWAFQKPGFLAIVSPGEQGHLVQAALGLAGSREKFKGYHDEQSGYPLVNFQFDPEMFFQTLVKTILPTPIWHGLL